VRERKRDRQRQRQRKRESKTLGERADNKNHRQRRDAQLV
jgi:hypothetical protein